MRFRGILLVAVVSLGGCTCRARVEPVSRDDDAIVREDAHHDVEPDRTRFTVIGTDVVDLASKKVVHSFPLRPDRFVVDAGAVYAWSAHRLSATELPSGKLRWSYEDLSPQPVVGVRVDDRRVFVGWRDVVYAFDRATGERTTMLSSATREISGVARVGRSLVVQEDDVLTFVDVEDRTALRKKASPLLPRLESNESTVLCVGVGSAPHAVMIVDAFDDRGEARWPELSFDAGSGGWPPVAVAQITGTHLALTGADPSQRAVVIALATGALDYDRVDAPMQAIVEDAAGGLDVVLTMAASSRTVAAVDAKTNARRWTATLPCSSSSLAVAARGEQVFLAGYERVDGGGCIVAVDRAKGKVEWTAGLSDPHISHSEYDNDVALRVRGDELVAIGREAGAEHVDVFAVANGDRRFAHVVPF